MIVFNLVFMVYFGPIQAFVKRKDIQGRIKLVAAEIEKSKLEIPKADSNKVEPM